MDPISRPDVSVTSSADLLVSLPLDVLSSILALCAFRPVMRSAAVVCKRFRIAALRRVRSLSLPSQANLDDAATLLRYMPHLTHLRLQDFRPPSTPISFPHSLRALSLHRFSDGAPSSAEVAVLMTQAASLTDLELAVNGRTAACLIDFLYACTSLTRLSLKTPPRAASDPFFCYHSLYAKWPHLTSLSVEGGGASRELLASRSACHVASQLKSLRIEELDTATLLRALSRIRYSALTELNLNETLVLPVQVHSLASSLAPGLRLRLAIDATEYAAYLPLAPYLTEAVLSVGAELLIGVMTVMITAYPRLESVPNTRPLSGMWISHYCQKPAAQHLLRSISIESHFGEVDLSPLSALTALTHLRYRDHSHRESPPRIPQHPNLRSLELRGNVPRLFDDSITTRLPRLRDLTLSYPPSQDAEATLLASLPALAHLERLVVPAWFYTAPSVASRLRGWCNVYCDGNDPQAPPALANPWRNEV